MIEETTPTSVVTYGFFEQTDLDHPTGFYVITDFSDQLLAFYEFGSIITDCAIKSHSPYTYLVFKVYQTSGSSYEKEIFVMTNLSGVTGKMLARDIGSGGLLPMST